jgi:hypothetical protein
MMPVHKNEKKPPRKSPNILAYQSFCLSATTLAEERDF